MSFQRRRETGCRLAAGHALFFLAIALLYAPALAAKKSYVVYMGSHSHGRDASPAAFEMAALKHYSFLSSFLGSEERSREAIIYSYTKYINGFAANLEEEEAAAIASRFGEDTILANLDTGVWPESLSFSDLGYGPVPSRWKGSCENNTQAGVPCNRKLIGAKFFSKAYEEYVQPIEPSMKTPRDHDGHGTYTLSTAAGNFVPGAALFDVVPGTAKGGSPRARVAAYKVCWPTVGDNGGCYDADMLAAFDEAIHDGVDVLSVSIGGDPNDYFNDGISIGTFHAVKNGITVVCAAGNSGPSAGTVSNVSPWIITVGASTLDREFQSFAKIQSGKQFKGLSLSGPLPGNRFYPLITGAQAQAANATAGDAMLCLPGTLDSGKAAGKIVVCLRGRNGRVDKGRNVALAGGVGMILCNDIASGNEIISDPHVIPATHINYEDGNVVFAYVNKTKNPLGLITAPKVVVGTKPSPFMAAFSSRGPNTITPEILKPDITAPGVNIVAAYSEGTSPTGLPFDKRTVKFNVDSGTSMATPHVAGVVGLLKSQHPDWSPAAIRSAIMTSARTRGNTLTPMLDGASLKKATPFSCGSGHIRPNRAVDPGLVYDMTTEDYLDFLCALGYNQTLIKQFTDEPHLCRDSLSLFDVNYPSFSIPNFSGKATLYRKVKNVGSPGTYGVTIHHPPGVTVSVEPKRLIFDRVGDEKGFMVTIKASRTNIREREFTFGEITWTDGRHYVRSPIAIGLGN
ncbi:hypothetical protein SAY87_014632 [Trapa incisa]|uniref:Subtilisin-like protease n=1 Tax=Trapa incisa TaxID=236973 RepID=A0AAN7GKA7_9MYRT|nr:hypothetical protein SAY87_014632 [Trapa incisa]